MKNLMLLLVLFLSLESFSMNYCTGTDQVVTGGDGRPWPFGKEIKIPWKSIQGVWGVASGDCTSYFIFKFVKSDDTGETIAQITQYDPVSCKLIAKGSGFLFDKYIYARMIKKGVSYDLTVHAFNESDINLSKRSQITPINFGTKFVLALTLFPVGSWDERTSYEIGKLDSSTSRVCIGKQ